VFGNLCVCLVLLCVCVRCFECVFFFFRVRQEAEANKLLLTKEFLDYSRALAIGGWVGGWVGLVCVCPITDLV
jgi:hypothetical protein